MHRYTISKLMEQKMAVSYISEIGNDFNRRWTDIFSVL